MRTMNTKRLTTKDIALTVGMHPSTIRRWCNRGMLPYNTDWCGNRTFPDYAVMEAKKLAGLNFKEGDITVR